MMLPANPPSSAAPTRPLGWLFGLALVATLWFTTRGWDAVILDRHEFRQLQTAVSAHWMKEDGYQLDYETPLFGPPWSIPMEFPVYQFLVAQTSRLLGTGLEPTARGVSLFFFLAALPALYGLLGLFALPASRRLLVLAAVLLSPTYLFYARAFMIETTALCLAVWFLLALSCAVRRGSIPWSAAAAGFGAAAALAKVTTFLIYCLPAGLVTLWLLAPRWRQGGRAAAGRRAVLAVLPVVCAVAAGGWWIRHSDAVKHSNPFAGFLTSGELVKWNWGTLEQRVSPVFWEGFWSNVSGCVLGETALGALIVAGALAGRRHRQMAFWCAGLFLASTLLFSNLFFHHDYYYSANALLLMTGAGLLLAGAWDNDRVPLAARGLLLAVFFSSQWLVYYRGYADYARRELPAPPGIAAVLRASVPADGVVLIYGWDWNSLIPYYAQRRALMVPGGREDEIKVLEDILVRLPPRRIAALLVRSDVLRQSMSFIRWRTQRFSLSSAPFASSVDGDLYLPEAAVPAAALRLQGKSFPGVTLNTSPPPDPNEDKLQVENPARLALPLFSPAPAQASSMFGLTPSEIAGRPVLLAHAVSELQFSPPAGASRIAAVVGLLDEAYAPGGPAVTDGIGVEIYEQRPDGLRRLLYRRELDPLHEPNDRGPQNIRLDEAGPFAGRLVFKITPGPRNNFVNDWAYWGRIEIR
jgi:hypothetical protein